MRYNRDFLLFARKRPEEIENEDIKKYLYYMIDRKKVSTSTLNVIINALKFFYGVKGSIYGMVRILFRFGSIYVILCIWTS